MTLDEFRSLVDERQELARQIYHALGRDDDVTEMMARYDAINAKLQAGLKRQ